MVATHYDPWRVILVSNEYSYIMKRLLQSLIATGALAIAALVVLPTAAQAAYHTVVPGNTLSLLFGSRWGEVCRINNIVNCDLIFPGQVLSDGLDGSTAPAQVVPAKPARAPQVVQRPSSANTYGAGWCTWWVKERRPDIPNGWGNAGYNWVTAARRAGYATGSAPRAGAIGVMTGHVVYVESVNGNGSVNISEMGWNYTAWNKNYRTVPASSFTYIY